MISATVALVRAWNTALPSLNLTTEAGSVIARRCALHESWRRARTRAARAGYPLGMTTSEHDEIRSREGDEDEQRDRKPGGAEGGQSDATDKPPAAPADDSSEVGDTDQHSSADA